MQKRYQVFVSSTYEDLQEERKEVIQALLELDCIPSGMELFPAANEDQWTLIKKVIDECDYYIVIIAGRYGSINSDGVSYTEMEYRYAFEQNKPIIAFLHKEPDNISVKKAEKNESARQALNNFRQLAQKKTCKFWTTPADLGSVVSRSLIMLMKNHPAIGWVRADLLPDKETSEMILELKMKNEELESKLKASLSEAPSGSEEFSQGDDKYMVKINISLRHIYTRNRKSLEDSIVITWNEIFASIGPVIIDQASEDDMHKSINNYLSEKWKESKEHKRYINSEYEQIEYRVNDITFDTIKIQLRAIGLIAKSTRQKGVKDTQTYWTLTPYGESCLTKLRAIRKGQ